MKKYTDEIVKFIRENYETYPQKEIVDLLNKKFKLKTTMKSLKSVLTRYGIKKSPEALKRVQYFIYTEERVKFLRKEYANTLITIEKLRTKFNKQFKLNVSINSVTTSLHKHQIKRNPDILYQIRMKNIKEAWKVEKHCGAPRIYSNEVIAFMKKCSKDGLTRNQALEKCRTKFGYYFPVSGFARISSDNKIKYVQGYLENQPEIFKNKKFIKFMKKNKNYRVYELRDKIIEKFGINLINDEIRHFCVRNKIKIKENDV